MGVGHRVAYITVTENAIKWWVTVHGLSHHETRLLAEKVSDQPESHDDKEKVVEFSIPSWQVMMGFVIYLASNEGCPKVCEDFTITEKAPTRAFPWLKVPTSAFTFKALC